MVLGYIAGERRLGMTTRCIELRGLRDSSAKRWFVNAAKGDAAASPGPRLDGELRPRLTYLMEASAGTVSRLVRSKSWVKGAAAAGPVLGVAGDCFSVHRLSALHTGGT
jgi:hypothetical protein